MNRDALREELAEDEGCKFEIYLDHLHLPTFGIGHLIKEHDPEYGLPVGTEVSEDRVRKAFNLDIAVTIEDCRRLCDNVGVDFNELDLRYPDGALALCNQCFNLGYPRHSKFKKMWAAVAEAMEDPKAWLTVAAEAEDSRWFDQVPNRAKRITARFRALADG
jgi:GH24 family phage-related lysozyme (muramidase)